jgi:hypothetical protein
MNDEIKLRKIDEPEVKTLPVGIYAITFDSRLVFVRRMGGRFVPVSKAEQEELWRQFPPC